MISLIYRRSLLKVFLTQKQCLLVKFIPFVSRQFNLFLINSFRLPLENILPKVQCPMASHNSQFICHGLEDYHVLLYELLQWYFLSHLNCTPLIKQHNYILQYAYLIQLEAFPII